MNFISLVALSAMVAQASTVYMAGDSTMALEGGGNGTNGWGEYLGQYLTIAVVNEAVAGTSARSYTEENRFDAITEMVDPGDFVIIEFGHNDGTASPDNGRQDAVGDGYNTTEIVQTANGTSILIHSFPFYIQNAVTALQAKGAIPIVSSQTPDNIWNGDGTALAAPSRFVQYAEESAQRTGATYVNHFGYVAQAYEALGMQLVDTFYPNDHTHTSPAGANVVAEAFVRGMLCGNSSSFKDVINETGQTVPNGCLS